MYTVTVTQTIQIEAEDTWDAAVTAMQSRNAPDTVSSFVVTVTEA